MQLMPEPKCYMPRALGHSPRFNYLTTRPQNKIKKVPCSTGKGQIYINTHSWGGCTPRGRVLRYISDGECTKSFWGFEISNLGTFGLAIFWWSFLGQKYFMWRKSRLLGFILYCWTFFRYVLVHWTFFGVQLQPSWTFWGSNNLASFAPPRH